MKKNVTGTLKCSGAKLSYIHSHKADMQILYKQNENGQIRHGTTASSIA